MATLFKRLLGFDAVSIVATEVTERRGEQVVEVEVTHRRNRRMVCSGCGERCTAGDPRLRRHVLWLVWSAPKSVVAHLQRVDWHSIGVMIERVVGVHTATRSGDGEDGLTRIGIDEVAYRKGHRYLMCVTDHDSGRLVRAARGRSEQTAAAFFRTLGPQRCGLIRAVSVDLHGGWIRATRTRCPNARICADPFHVIKLAGQALDELCRGLWQCCVRLIPGGRRESKARASRSAAQRQPTPAGSVDPRRARRDEQRSVPRVAAHRPTQAVYRQDNATAR